MLFRSQAPSRPWFEHNLRAIVGRLKSLANAGIALASLPEIGEAPFSTNPVQSALNTSFADYAAIIERVANEEGAAYVPCYERFHERVVAEPGKAFTSFSFREFYRDYLWREFILHYGFDEIADMNGWKFHIDGVHLNTRGGMILADTVRDYLDGDRP